jgi:hypothetical protein
MATNTELLAPWAGAARGVNHLADVIAQLGQCALHLVDEYVAEVGEGARLAAGQLVHAAHELDKLARVDVRVTAILYVGDQRLGNAGTVVVDTRR